MKNSLPKTPNIGFLKKLTTQTGILQHTSFGVPDRSLGYALDDNARALIVAIEYYKQHEDPAVLELAVTYLSFLIHSKKADGYFHNFQTFDHQFVDTTSEDAFGEAIWALGEVISSDVRDDLTGAAKRLFGEIKGNISKLKYARAKAYSLLGLVKMAEKENSKEVSTLIDSLTESLIKQYTANKSENWNWFENILNYGNYILPAALFEVFSLKNDEQVLNIAIESLQFLNRNSFDKGVPSPIGSEGWMKKGETKPIFDQQPIDASYGVVANMAALKATKDLHFLNQAKLWFSWYHGANVQKVQVCDPKTGACFDAVTAGGVNLNQGAESVVCYLLAHLYLSHVQIEQKTLFEVAR